MNFFKNTLKLTFNLKIINNSDLGKLKQKLDQTLAQQDKVEKFFMAREVCDEAFAHLFSSALDAADGLDAGKFNPKNYDKYDGIHKAAKEIVSGLSNQITAQDILTSKRLKQYLSTPSESRGLGMKTYLDVLQAAKPAINDRKVIGQWTIKA